MKKSLITSGPGNSRYLIISQLSLYFELILNKLTKFKIMSGSFVRKTIAKSIV